MGDEGQKGDQIELSPRGTNHLHGNTQTLGGICETSQVNINKIIFKLGSYPLRFLETTWFTAPNGGVSVSPLYRLVSGLMNLGVVRDGGGDTASIPIRSALRQHVFLVYYT
jgi:hypothetical protein